MLMVGSTAVQEKKPGSLSLVYYTVQDVHTYKCMAPHCVTMKTTSHWTAPDHEDRVTCKPATQGRHIASMTPRQNSQADITQAKSCCLEHWDQSSPFMSDHCHTLGYQTSYILKLIRIAQKKLITFCADRPPAQVQKRSCHTGQEVIRKNLAHL